MASIPRRPPPPPPPLERPKTSPNPPSLPRRRPQSLIVIYCRVIRLSATPSTLSVVAVIPSSIVELHTRISPGEGVTGEGRGPLFVSLHAEKDDIILPRSPRLMYTHSRCLTAFSLHRRRSRMEVRPFVWSMAYLCMGHPVPITILAN